MIVGIHPHADTEVGKLSGIEIACFQRGKRFETSADIFVGARPYADRIVGRLNSSFILELS